MSYYQNAIRERIAKTGNIGIIAGHVEYVLRATHGTLDHLSESMFNAEIDATVAELRSCDPATFAMVDRGARAERFI